MRHAPSPRTAGGGLDPDAMTAAHRTLPLYTIVKVTRLDSGRAVVVMITDRGPHIKGRIIDLSPAAARKLGLIHDGLAKCRLEVLAYPYDAEDSDKKSGKGEDAL